ncbi:MAG: hypothetical protein LBK73_04465 [Treponema sp.]|jgi:hypothetical protein|nr:hypothetical protein [Treponema sp.]
MRKNERRRLKPGLPPIYFCKKCVISLILPLVASVSLSAQTPNSVQDAIRIDSKDFPQWAKDVRRFDIIAFGAFPFAFFTASFITDSIRWTQFSGDMRYAPWPLKGAGAYDPTTQEKMQIIGIAAGISLFVALADFVVIQIKRHSAKQKSVRTQDNQPVIIRQPLRANPTAQDEANGEE